MQHVTAPGVTISGFDASHYDETIDFNQAKANGYQFCYAKATEGTGVLDAKFKLNKSKALAAGLLFGAYHFFRPGQDPLKQADFFLKSADISKGDLIPMFDWEVSQGPGDVALASVWLNRVSGILNRKPAIYGPPYLLNGFNLPKVFQEYPLFIAHYGTLAPLIPQPWNVWTFHQFTDKGSVPGVPVPSVDHDRFNGPIEQLQKLVI